MLSAYIYIYAI